LNYSAVAITVGGIESDGNSINRDINKAQETTFEEPIDAKVSVQVETIIDTGKQAKAFAVGDRQYLAVNIEW
jgi:hypothetical protein